jgi:hypothetical protein
MGQAKQRKLAGTYPVQDGTRPMTDARKSGKWNPSCRKCHGTGVVSYYVEGTETKKVACSCEFKQLTPAEKKGVDEQRNIDDIRAAVDIGVAHAQFDAEKKS